LNSTNARAAAVAPTDYRVVTNYGKFDDTTQVAAAYPTDEYVTKETHHARPI